MISEEKKAYNRKYYLENKARLKEQNRQYREKNLERLTKLYKENYQEHKEERRAQQAEYNNAGVERESQTSSLGASKKAAHV